MGPTMLGIRDILVGSGSRVPYLWQIDPDRTLFFSDFKVAQKVYFLYIFSYNLPAGTLSSVLKFKFLLKFLVKILFCTNYFRPKNKRIRLRIRVPNTGGRTRFPAKEILHVTVIWILIWTVFWTQETNIPSLVWIRIPVLRKISKWHIEKNLTQS